MCVIIHQEYDSVIPDEYLNNAAYNNDDGWGMVFLAGDESGPFGRKFVVRRGMKPHKFTKEAKKWGKFEGLLHCRITTHGDTNIENTHPFHLTDKSGNELWLMHNGMLDIPDSIDKNMSDTWHMARLLENFHDLPDMLQQEFFRESLGNMIGANKLAFIDLKYGVTIINKELGVERNGAWYSNRTAFYRSHYGGYSCGAGDYDGSNWLKERGYTFDPITKIWGPPKDVQIGAGAPALGPGEVSDETLKIENNWVAAKKAFPNYKGAWKPIYKTYADGEEDKKEIIAWVPGNPEAAAASNKPKTSVEKTEEVEEGEITASEVEDDGTIYLKDDEVQELLDADMPSGLDDEGVDMKEIHALVDWWLMSGADAAMIYDDVLGFPYSTAFAIEQLVLKVKSQDALIKTLRSSNEDMQEENDALKKKIEDTTK